MQRDTFGDLFGTQAISFLDEFILETVQRCTPHVIRQVIRGVLAHLLLNTQYFTAKTQIRMGRGKGNSL